MSFYSGNTEAPIHVIQSEVIMVPPEEERTGSTNGHRRRETSQRVLIVDDNEPFRERLARAFRDRGYPTRTAADGGEAIQQCRLLPPDLAVIDLRMPGMSGLDLLREIRAITPSTRVVVLSGFGSIAAALDAVRLGATNFLPKPADIDDILAAFDRGEANDLEPVPAEHEVPSLARAEWEHIHRVLSECCGNVSEAARRLGIHRRSLQRKLRKRAPN